MTWRIGVAHAQPPPQLGDGPPILREGTARLRLIAEAQTETTANPRTGRRQVDHPTPTPTTGAGKPKTPSSQKGLGRAHPELRGEGRGIPPHAHSDFPGSTYSTLKSPHSLQTLPEGC